LVILAAVVHREDLERLLEEGADEVGLRGAVSQLADELRQADASGTSADLEIAAWERGARKVPLIKLLGRAARSSDLALQLVAERLSDRDSSGSPAFDPYPGHVAEGVAFCAAEALVACGSPSNGPANHRVDCAWHPMSCGCSPSPRCVGTRRAGWVSCAATHLRR
jgi:hypothetical protein